MIKNKSIIVFSFVGRTQRNFRTTARELALWLVVFLGLGCLVAVWKLAQEYRGRREAQQTMHAGTAYTVCGALSVRIGSPLETQNGRWIRKHR